MPKATPQKRERALISVPDEHPDSPYPCVPPAEAFTEEGEVTFLRARDLESVAAHLLDHYQEFEHLKRLHIAYLWKRTGGSRSGNATQGKTVKAGGLVRHFSDMDFVIWLAADHLREMNEGDNENERKCATFWQVEALMYHELTHAQVDADANPVLRGHDFEGFAKEITEFGAWDTSAEIMRVAFKQLSLW